MCLIDFSQQQRRLGGRFISKRRSLSNKSAYWLNIRINALES